MIFFFVVAKIRLLYKTFYCLMLLYEIIHYNNKNKFESPSLNLVFRSLRKTHVVEGRLIPELGSLPAAPTLGDNCLDVLRAGVMRVQNEPPGIARGLIPGHPKDCNVAEHSTVEFHGIMCRAFQLQSTL